jgi:succinyl-CoA synthetase beta subunit
MNIHEYQAKQLLAEFNVPTPRGGVAFTPEEAQALAEELGGGRYVVKAQIHAGGRGKAGGVKIVDSPAEAGQAAKELIGTTLITHQTGPEGRVVGKVLVEEGLDIAAELYLGAVIDRSTGRVTFMVSTEGGVEIEKVAAETPEKIIKVSVDPGTGMMPFVSRKIAYALGLDKDQTKAVASFAGALYKAFLSKDCSLAEINPLAITTDGRAIALDAKITVDDNALFRHADLKEMLDPGEEDERELKAKEFGFSYISLDGNIGCMVNGAGLAMATMDEIKQHGGEPANFLDVGGGANAETVAAAFQLILSDEKVNAVLINIFGGIMRCDTIAEGVIAAAQKTGITVPLVVRLQGTNAERGRKLLAESGLAITAAEHMGEAAGKIVAAVGGK